MGLEPVNIQKTYTQSSGWENQSNSKNDSQVRSTLASKDSSAEAPWYQSIADFFYSCWLTLKYYLTCGCSAPKEKETEEVKPVEEQIKDFFKSKVKVKKIFTIGSDRVGLIFNPNGQAWQGKGCYIGNSVAVISEKQISDESLKMIKELIPSGYEYTELQYDKPMFKEFGF